MHELALQLLDAPLSCCDLALKAAEYHFLRIECQLGNSNLLPCPVDHLLEHQVGLFVAMSIAVCLQFEDKVQQLVKKMAGDWVGGDGEIWKV